MTGLTVALDYFYSFRSTKENDYGYGELRLTYDLPADGSLVIRTGDPAGNKPQDFAMIDRILLVAPLGN